MPSGNGAKKRQQQERHAKEKMQQSKGSQLEARAAALKYTCPVCKTAHPDILHFPAHPDILPDEAATDIPKDSMEVLVSNSSSSTDGQGVKLFGDEISDSSSSNPSSSINTNSSTFDDVFSQPFWKSTCSNEKTNLGNNDSSQRDHSDQDDGYISEWEADVAPRTRAEFVAICRAELAAKQAAAARTASGRQSSFTSSSSNVSESTTKSTSTSSSNGHSTKVAKSRKPGARPKSSSKSATSCSNSKMDVDEFDKEPSASASSCSSPSKSSSAAIFTSKNSKSLAKKKSKSKQSASSSSFSSTSAQPVSRVYMLLVVKEAGITCKTCKRKFERGQVCLGYSDNGRIASEEWRCMNTLCLNEAIIIDLIKSCKNGSFSDVWGFDDFVRDPHQETIVSIWQNLADLTRDELEFLPLSSMPKLEESEIQSQMIREEARLSLESNEDSESMSNYHGSNKASKLVPKAHSKSTKGKDSDEEYENSIDDDIEDEESKSENSDTELIIASGSSSKAKNLKPSSSQHRSKIKLINNCNFKSGAQSDDPNYQQRQYACDQCHYRSSKKSSLTNHIRTHTGEKPFACDQCDYRSSEKRNLTNHIRTHTGEKPFSCDQCDYRSSAKSNLTKHIRTHTG